MQNKRIIISQLISVITWISRQYPDKRYVAVCTSPESYIRMYYLVKGIPDYYAIKSTIERKH
jgi:hypothetical protein